MNLNDYLSDKQATDLAKAIGATSTEISHWRNGKREVPIGRCVAIERATGGLVTRRDLRPDDWSHYWPELDEDAA